jgi:hypothetical protein
MIKCYKVFSTNTATSLKSAVIRGKNAMVYHPLKWSKRTYWGPMVFTSLDRAQDFIKYNKEFLYIPQIWVCVAKRERVYEGYMPFSNVYSKLTPKEVRKARIIMKREHGNSKTGSWRYTCNGEVVIAEQIMPVERVG